MGCGLISWASVTVGKWENLKLESILTQCLYLRRHRDGD